MVTLQFYSKLFGSLFVLLAKCQFRIDIENFNRRRNSRACVQLALLLLLLFAQPFSHFSWHCIIMRNRAVFVNGLTST